ncbi:hypothetical protein E4U55_008114 [Claviceps digitariae]|nr:hypothetical protein E4U55_008114 [Claviceps digitariae]
MDFTSQYQFGDGQAYQAFMSVPPLTPSNSHSTLEDFNTNTTSPDAFETIHNQPEQFQGFNYTQTFPDPAQLHNHGFSSPPTPPDPIHFTTQPAAAHGSAPDRSHLQHGAPAIIGQVHGHSSVGIEAAAAADVGGLEDPSQLRGGSDDDESLTPAQSRRKAQNRAAQRAFRERKEKHVKDLEAKLAHMEAARQQAAVENERLKRDLQKMSTENEILRATSSISHNNLHASYSPEPATTGPMNYKPTDFYSNVLQNHQNKFPSHRIVTSDDGERLLAAGATWDFIINHDLYKKGLVDMEDVSERLKTCALCDGQGPVFSEQAIIRAMEQSVTSGSDDLL